MKPRKLVGVQQAVSRVDAGRRRRRRRLWFDRLLCGLVLLLAAAALLHGLGGRHIGLAGLALWTLIGALWAAGVLLGGPSLRRSREIREAIERASSARARNP